MRRHLDRISDELDMISLDLFRLHSRVLRIAAEINPAWERKRRAANQTEQNETPHEGKGADTYTSPNPQGPDE